MIAVEGDVGAARSVVVAEHFGLGRPTAAMVPHQHTSFRTWRLCTAQGSFLVKEVWESGPPYWSRKAFAMTRFEQRARDVGIRIPRGYASDDRPLAQLGDLGAFKVYEWLEHSPLTHDLRLAQWLGQTLAGLHRLEHTQWT
ncbi:phosphotransferase [Pengzhenrongella sp.]|uniref:phosphotransferase n=1 Tax=Pengzhenrongella sp. TaxID=2888820 RepID=UPI002F938798